MKFSVIVPAFNEERHIAKCIQALAAQTFPKEDFEVILVDNASTDATVAIARNFLGSMNLQVLSSSADNVAGVRNEGAAMAQGEVLAFLDSDCFTQTGWLGNSWSVRQPQTLWGAHYLVPKDGTWVGRVWAEFQATEQEGQTNFIPSSNLFIGREDFVRIGGFQSSMETSEDVELSLRARRHGLQVVAFPVLAVYHGGTPRTLGHFFRQNRWHGKHVLRMFLANLPSTDHLPLLLISLYTLLTLCGTAVGAILIPVCHCWIAAVIFATLLLLPALLLVALKTLPKGRIAAAPALFILYFTYLLARATSLVQRPKRSHR